VDVYPFLNVTNGRSCKFFCMAMVVYISNVVAANSLSFLHCGGIMAGLLEGKGKRKG